MDDPSGDGDIESLVIHKEYGCENPIETEVQTVDGLTLAQTNQTVHMLECLGFVCLNKEQFNNVTCLDYQIRQCCHLCKKFFCFIYGLL